MSKKNKRDWDRGRKQSWFKFCEYENRKAAYRAAQDMMKEHRKQKIQATLALVSKSRLGDFAYYVGRQHNVDALCGRFGIKEIKKYEPHED